MSSCGTSIEEGKIHSLTEEEKVWLNKFFHDLLFVEGGIYTLWGSKPVTEIVLYHYTEEELERMQRGLSEEEKRDCYIEENYDLPLNWERWEKIQARFPFKRHLLFRSHFDEDGKASFVYFVDILKAAVTIAANYEMFQRAVGFDFHPVEMVLEMPESESHFWKKVRTATQAPLLWGILFGYGQVNAYAFYWKYFDSSKSCKKVLESHPHKLSNPFPKGQVHLSLNNFNLPTFVSFEDPDPLVLYYQKERDAIKEAYLGNNLLEVTFKKLTEGM